uniref:Cyclic nucleotide-binding domain-containing protein n=1 Tax=Chromera velia CCMP2878 TaxID=1169474 RepID=A0A0G4HLF9_9ALVE|eukprot:Cvel_7344.t1-p1 / transcript=Cvel_7344.t1 / gene=Cvel_7344 / organism=Chromera_velia_CCMP2878 / gene_product=hypothetical protein / transcript_product=hypothetical protein / location=Cvel_scaffold381:2871-10442(+) / protein_length=1252 / sequence_SO=supercontig / SO=protein_coding / is_pseudo=false
MENDHLSYKLTAASDPQILFANKGRQERPHPLAETLGIVRSSTGLNEKDGTDDHADPLRTYALELDVAEHADTPRACPAQSLENEQGNAATLRGAGYFHRGFKARLLDETNAAIHLYTKALSENPNHFAALVNLAFCLMDQGGFAAAVPLLQRAVAINPRKLKVFVNLAVCHFHLGEFTETLDVCDVALRLCGGMPKRSPARICRQVAGAISAAKQSSDAPAAPWNLDADIETSFPKGSIFPSGRLGRIAGMKGRQQQTHVSGGRKKGALSPRAEKVSEALREGELRALKEARRVRPFLADPADPPASSAGGAASSRDPVYAWPDLHHGPAKTSVSYRDQGKTRHMDVERETSGGGSTAREKEKEQSQEEEEREGGCNSNRTSPPGSVWPSPRIGYRNLVPSNLKSLQKGKQSATCLFRGGGKPGEGTAEHDGLKALLLYYRYGTKSRGAEKQEKEGPGTRIPSAVAAVKNGGLRADVSLSVSGLLPPPLPEADLKGDHYQVSRKTEDGEEEEDATGTAEEEGERATTEEGRRAGVKERQTAENASRSRETVTSGSSRRGKQTTGEEGKEETPEEAEEEEGSEEEEADGEEEQYLFFRPPAAGGGGAGPLFSTAASPSSGAPGGQGNRERAGDAPPQPLLLAELREVCREMEKPPRRREVEKILPLVQRLKFFQNRSKKRVTAILLVSHLLRFPKFAPVYTEGDVADALYVVLAGSVSSKVTRAHWQPESQMSPVTAFDGESFGDSTLAHRGAKAPQVPKHWDNLERKPCQFVSADETPEGAAARKRPFAMASGACARRSEKTLRRLRTAPFFSEVADHMLLQLQGQVRVQKYRYGEWPIVSGERPQCLCLLVSGLCRIVVPEEEVEAAWREAHPDKNLLKLEARASAEAAAKEEEERDRERDREQKMAAAAAAAEKEKAAAGGKRNSTENAQAQGGGGSFEMGEAEGRSPASPGQGLDITGGGHQESPSGALSLPVPTKRAPQAIATPVPCTASTVNPAFTAHRPQGRRSLANGTLEPLTFGWVGAGGFFGKAAIRAESLEGVEGAEAERQAARLSLVVASASAEFLFLPATVFDELPQQVKRQVLRRLRDLTDAALPSPAELKNFLRGFETSICIGSIKHIFRDPKRNILEEAKLLKRTTLSDGPADAKAEGPQFSLAFGTKTFTTIRPHSSAMRRRGADWPRGPRPASAGGPHSKLKGTGARPSGSGQTLPVPLKQGAMSPSQTGPVPLSASGGGNTTALLEAAAAAAR